MFNLTTYDGHEIKQHQKLRCQKQENCSLCLLILQGSQAHGPLFLRNKLRKLLSLKLSSCDPIIKTSLDQRHTEAVQSFLLGSASENGSVGETTTHDSVVRGTVRSACIYTPWRKPLSNSSILFQFVRSIKCKKTFSLEVIPSYQIT